jgi:spore coat polysaccharide biosynthesis protein SpsF
MTHRWTLDYPADFEFIRTVYEHLYPDNAHFCLGDILRLLERRPDIAAINSGLIGINWYRHHMNELRTIEPSQTRPDRLQGAS